MRYPAADLERFLDDSYRHDSVEAWIKSADEAVWVAEDASGALTGYLHIGPSTLPHPDTQPGDGELKRIYVARTAQGSGLGRALMDLALSHLDPVGEACVWIGVWSGNLKAQRLYARHGFTKAGEYEFPVGSVRDQEFILRRGPA